MNRHVVKVGVRFALVCALAVGVAQVSVSEEKPSASGAGKSAQPAATKSKTNASLPIYRPPSVGQPARTVGGGSRAPGNPPSIYVLVPDHPGRTASAQPTLYWYMDHAPPAGAKVRFTLLDEQSDDPIVAADLATPTRGGIYAIDLAKHGVKLETGKEYEWSVALAVDPKDSAKDVVASGWIVRVPSGEPVASGTSEAVRRLAEQGLWYDALAEVEGMMKTQPDDASEMRSALLRQVGLEAVAAAL